MKEWAQGGGDEKAVQKSKIAQLAASIDRTRVDVILAAFRLKVQQGKAAEGAGLLDLMIKAGGTIEDNLPILELLGRELAAKMAVFRKEGKTKAADDLRAGLAELLKKITTAKKLPATSVLFIGQTLQNVGENEKAIEMLKRVPVPEFAGWETKKNEEIPQELRGRVQNQIRDYSIAQLSIARALRELKKYDEAEKMLNNIIGSWGAGRLYFRKELATLHEEKGASLTDSKAATTEWGKAKQVWETLLGIHRARLSKITPMTPPDEVKQMRNAFADAYFDLQRYQLKVYQQLVKDPTRTQTNYETVAQRCLDMEKQIPAADWQPEVQHRYADLLRDFPPVMAAYKTKGGKLFLEKLPLNP
jgi:tetratricopeptide (TPR) repeat protein